MFETKKVYDEYGISGIIMPYLWLLIYIYVHYKVIGFWFTTPTIVDYITLIIHIALTVIAIIFSHKVLLWAAEKQEGNVVSEFFSAIIRKMCDSPIELITKVVDPITNKDYETGTKVVKFIFYLLYTLLAIFGGYIIFIIVSLIFLVTFYIEKKE